MENNNYNKVFTLPNGEEAKVKDTYMGRYISLLVGRKYTDPDNDGAKNIPINEEWLSEKIKKIEIPHQVGNHEDSKLHSVMDTYVLAEDKNWVEYPNVKIYVGDHAQNCTYYTKIEVLLLDEEGYSRRIFLEWGGAYNFINYIAQLSDNLWGEIYEHPEKYNANVDDDNETLSIEMYNDETGDATIVEFENERQLGKLICSARVVEFTETIVKE